ncbi:T9SS type A sorting domain-containing protein [Hymenobacter lapidiphilus]|uniref:T9SS type A sorting domain-containing protein n=1 Tax=Hymenobacter lapidiphilus TaxID=2608003 RepID=A0A7Y7PMR3_9BACT|nr:T9SS type A sorting domain-containing protein [Hymenobacter lapidiphilus]NVO30653.1 T9SS type A sorting domain-containing protein [Hymenobacter lapidiphilus]
MLALFVSLGSSNDAWAQAGVSSSFLDVRATTTTATATTTYYGTDSEDPASGNPAFDPTSTNPPTGATRNLGLFDLATGELRITSATLNVFTIGSSNNAVSGKLFYRAYLNGTASLPAYTVVDLANISRAGNSSFRTTSFSTAPTTTGGNILTGLLSGGTYQLEVYFRADGTGNSFPLINQNAQSTTPGPFRAEFSVVPPAVTPANALTVWNGSVSTDWTNPANWSNGVPNQLADALIPFERNESTGANQIPRFPALNDITERYAVRNLTVDAVSFTNRGLIRVTNGVLRIYGDLLNGANGILATADAIPTQGGTTFQSATISFEGGDQTFDQGRFANVNIAGTGIKSLTGLLELPGGTIRFLPTNPADGVLLRTTKFVNGQRDQPVVSTLGQEVVDLGELGRISAVVGEKETNTSFILGLTKASNIPQMGVPQSFGNIGLIVTTGNDGAGRFAITRSIGPFFVGRGSSAASQSVKRSYGVSVGNPNIDINATISFAYNDSDQNTGGMSINELNGNSEPELEIFRTTDSGASFTNLGGTANVASNTVTTAGVRSINTITLASRLNPLPVSLISFAALRSGNNVNLTWATATEVNNRDFAIQISEDGKTFRTLGIVVSKAQDGSTTVRQEYRFTDSETGKKALRYYRLLQTDRDGKQSYSSIQVVNFNVKSDQAGLSAYPNPFDAELKLNLQVKTAGDTRIVLLDTNGRVVSQQLITLPIGISTFPLNGIESLKSGLYFVQATMADGTQVTTRVVKK